MNRSRKRLYFPSQPRTHHIRNFVNFSVAPNSSWQDAKSTQEQNVGQVDRWKWNWRPRRWRAKAGLQNSTQNLKGLRKETKPPRKGTAIRTFLETGYASLSALFFSFLARYQLPAQLCKLQQFNHHCRLRGTLLVYQEEPPSWWCSKAFPFSPFFLSFSLPVSISLSLPSILLFSGTLKVRERESEKKWGRQRDPYKN